MKEQYCQIVTENTVIVITLLDSILCKLPGTKIAVPEISLTTRNVFCVGLPTQTASEREHDHHIQTS
jgi:hypothetical protein